MDLITLFLILGSISILLILIQFARILRKRPLVHNIEDPPSNVSVMGIEVLPGSTQSIVNSQEVPQIRVEDESENEEDTWLFTVTSSLVDKVSIIGDRELHFNEPCSIQTIQPFPETRENCYFEIKIIEMPENVTLYIGIGPKDDENVKITGKFKDSISYCSSTGQLNLSEFNHEYGSRLYPGDIIGCGYRPQTSRVFYTRNGRRFPRIIFDPHTPMYPTLYSTGPCTIEYNFGQAGFVLVSANTRHYGLAEPTNVIAPPPSYAHHSEDTSIISPRERTSFLSDASVTPIPSPALAPPPYLPSIKAETDTVVENQSYSTVT